MAKNSGTKTSLKDTTSITIIRIGRRAFRMSRHTVSALTILLLTILAVVLIFPYASTVQVFQLPKEGEVSKETIIAPVTFDVLKPSDDLEKQRKEAMNDVLEVLDHDSDIQRRVREKFVALRDMLLRINDRQTPDSVRTLLEGRLRTELSENTVHTLLRRPYLLDDAMFQAEQALENGISSVLLVSDEEQLEQLREDYNAPFDSYLFYDKQFVTLRRDSAEATVKVSDLPVKEIALENIIETLKVERMFDQEALNSLYELLDSYIIPNVTVNGEETAVRRQKASQAVLGIRGKVIKDAEIVRKHQVVTPEILGKLRSLHKALESREHGGEIQRVLSSNVGKVLLVIIPLIFMALYVKVFHPEMMANRNRLIALSCILIVQLGLIRIALLLIPRLFEGNAEITSLAPEFLVPTAVGSILVTILFDIKLSFVMTLFVSIFFGVSLGFNHAFFLFALLGGLTAGFSTRNIRYRWDFFRAIPPVAVVYGLYIFLWHMVAYNLAPMAVLQNLGLGVLNCILTTFLAMMTVTIFENVFDITTDMTLVEFSDMNHPLLKRLSIEAAGTYNHSVLVANLAESAAARVDANPLLVRVASYYHDVGKIAKPGYFVENQKVDKNIHNKLSPSMSALIISSHVKEGLEFAKKHKLPSAIQSAIAEHHGTSTVSFFYEKALEQDPHKQVQEKDFCYPGPRPQTRENAIIMLADSVEAASRSIATSSPKLLRELVKKIIHDKFASSQLDECNLTFQDLDKIIEGFMPVLQGIFHTRIEYPSKK
ncbi:MAG: HDIG domain-containing protein [Chitinivibrionales bacterium]|nr:HDIG domain-containing protein [Chitinivibrionales bacterium]MBD3396722.1 HDIG domain-containing protein [Chitinivibrionales bacterium]